MSNSSECRTEGNGNRPPSPTRRQSEPQLLSLNLFLSQINTYYFFFLLRLVCLFFTLSLALNNTDRTGKIKQLDMLRFCFSTLSLAFCTIILGYRAGEKLRRSAAQMQRGNASESRDLFIIIVLLSLFSILFLPRDFIGRL